MYMLQTNPIAVLSRITHKGTQSVAFFIEIQKFQMQCKGKQK